MRGPRSPWCRAISAPRSRTRVFDALVSNPPYLTTEEYAALDPSVRDWEPREALVSGADGLGPTTRILVEGRRVVRAGGWLAMEVDCTRAAECAAAGRRAGVVRRRHPCGPFRPRAIPARAEERHIVIWDKAQDLGRLIGQSTGVPGTPAGGGIAARRHGDRGQAGPDPDACAPGGPGRFARQDARPGHGRVVRERGSRPRDEQVGQAYVVARANFEKLMAKVNQQISEGMEKGASSSIITLG